MHQLPSELQLLIIEYLGPIDILHLQLTCKHNHLLIERSSKRIWRNCLRQQCYQNELFWPTFQGLSSASEFKDAATASHRVLNAYKFALEKQRGVLGAPEVTQTLISFPEDLDSATFSELYLVPGGRFLATFHQPKWLSIWDLRHSEAPSLSSEDELEEHVFRPKLMLRHGIEGFDGVVYIDSVVDTTKIRFLLKVQPELPASQDTVPFIEESNSQNVSAYEYLQLTLTDSTWLAERLGYLTIIHLEGSPGWIKFNTMSEENIILHSSNCTLTWDFVRHQASTWRLQGIDNVFDVFSFSNYVFYIGEEGVFGVEQPPFQPTERDCIPLPSPDVNTLTPFLFLPHQRKHVNIKRTSGPDSCNPHFRDYQTSLIYEIIETEESNGDPYGPEPVIKTIYRYHFHFNSSNPAKSSLDLIEASTVCRPQTEQPPETPHILHLHPYQHFNGRLGAIWAEEAEDEEYAEWSTTSIFFSLSSRFDPASAKLAFSGSEGSSTVVPDPRDLQLVRFWDKPDPVEEDSDTEEYEDPLNALTCEFCPHTGRVAVLWENANVGVTQVTLYDFLA